MRVITLITQTHTTNVYNYIIFTTSYNPFGQWIWIPLKRRQQEYDQDQGQGQKRMVDVQDCRANIQASYCIWNTSTSTTRIFFKYF